MAQVSVRLKTKHPSANVEFDDSTFVKITIGNRKPDVVGSCSKERYSIAVKTYDTVSMSMKKDVVSDQEIIKKVAEKLDTVFNYSQKTVEQSA